MYFGMVIPGAFSEETYRMSRNIYWLRDGAGLHMWVPRVWASLLAHRRYTTDLNL